MADLEAVLADVSYLMALEKSKTINRASKKMILPDPSVRSVMIRHLMDRDELKFESLIKQKLAFLLFKDFCIKNHDIRFELYDKIEKLKLIHDKNDRAESARTIIDSYFFNSTLMILISKPIVYSETVMANCGSSVVQASTGSGLSSGLTSTDRPKTPLTATSNVNSHNNLNVILNENENNSTNLINSKSSCSNQLTNQNQKSSKSHNFKKQTSEPLAEQSISITQAQAQTQTQTSKTSNNSHSQSSKNSPVFENKRKEQVLVMENTQNLDPTQAAELINRNRATSTKSENIISKSQNKLTKTLSHEEEPLGKSMVNSLEETTSHQPDNLNSASATNKTVPTSSSFSHSTSIPATLKLDCAEANKNYYPTNASSKSRTSKEKDKGNAESSRGPRNLSQNNNGQNNDLIPTQVVREYSIPDKIIQDIRSRHQKLQPLKTTRLIGDTDNNLMAKTDEELVQIYDKFPFREISAYLWLYLKHAVFVQFLQSDHFTRFCQWKNIELSITLSMNDFSVHRIIGRGGFGEVYGCRKADTGKMYAMKCLDKKRIKLKSGEQLALNERFILQLVSAGSEDCPFIVGMTYAFTTPYKVCFLLDLMNGGDLHYHLTQHIFTEEEVRFYVAEIALGLEHMHSRGVVYRDLKPANILLNEAGHVRISDLGLACDFISRRPHASVGTHGYMAPEVLQRGVAYDSSADWFSLACMIYKLLRGQSPFRPQRNKDKYEIDRLTLTKEVEMPSSFSEELSDMLSQLFQKDPKDRLCCQNENPTLGADELKSHPFFKEVNWEIMRNCGYPAPMIPPRGEVNAYDAFDIGNFDDDETKSIKLTDEDQKAWDGFHNVVSCRWQKEIAETIFESVNQEQDRIESKKKLKGNKHGSDDAQSLNVYMHSLGSQIKKLFGKSEHDGDKHGSSSPYAKGKDCIMHGYIYKLGGPFNSQWQRKYFYLFPNRIEAISESDGHHWLGW